MRLFTKGGNKSESCMEAYGRNTNSDENEFEKSWSNTSWKVSPSSECVNIFVWSQLKEFMSGSEKIDVVRLDWTGMTQMLCHLREINPFKNPSWTGVWYKCHYNLVNHINATVEATLLIKLTPSLNPSKNCKFCRPSKLKKDIEGRRIQIGTFCRGMRHFIGSTQSEKDRNLSGYWRKLPLKNHLPSIKGQILKGIVFSSLFFVVKGMNVGRLFSLGGRRKGQNKVLVFNLLC